MLLPGDPGDDIPPHTEHLNRRYCTHCAGAYATNFVRGMQEGPDPRYLKTSSCIKHYAGEFDAFDECRHCHEASLTCAWVVTTHRPPICTYHLRSKHRRCCNLSFSRAGYSLELWEGMDRHHFNAVV